MTEFDPSWEYLESVTLHDPMNMYKQMENNSNIFINVSFDNILNICSRAVNV